MEVNDMNRRNMRYIEAEIKHSRSDLLNKSNKNLTADILKEVAESLGLNIAYLHEDFNLRKEFAIRAEDVEIVKTLVKLAKTKEGKRLRCKSFTESNAECINTVVESFMTLFAHNGVAEEKIFEEWLATMRQTDFLLLKQYVAEQTPKFDEELNQYFFAPNERFENEDDRLTEDMLWRMLYHTPTLLSSSLR